MKTESEINEELEFRYLQVQTNDFSIYYLIKKIKKNNFFFDKMAINNLDHSRLIQSILIGLPVDPIWVTEDEFGQCHAIKGNEFINVIINFYNNELKIKLENSSFDECFFKDLYFSRQRAFENCELKFIRIPISLSDCAKNELIRRIKKQYCI